MTAVNAESSRESKWAWLGWAVYLAVSWTWCIGMFLPVLLVRDYGIWGWVVFAIPNVIGAAAMGWVLASEEAALEIMLNHRGATIAFSVVTIFFQLFFAGWFPLVTLAAQGGVLLLIAASFSLMLRDRRLAATAVFIWSLLVFGAVASARFAFRDEHGSFGIVPSGVQLAGLGAVSAFGFLLCPYLDLTFLRTRSRLSVSDSKKSFGVGFCIFFLMMIVFSLAYSQMISIPASLNRLASQLTPNVATLLWLHLGFQLAFSTVVHLEELRTHFSSWRLMYWVLIPALCVSFLVMVLAPAMPLQLRGMALVEVGYRVLLGMYGLVFPAYVWLCMLPGRGRVKPSRQQLIVLAVTILAASPMYWMGFIERKTLWLVPGVAVVLLARLFIKAPAATSHGVVASGS